MDWRHQIVGTDASGGLHWQLEVDCSTPTTLTLTLSGAWVLMASLPSLDSVVAAIQRCPELTTIDINTQNLSVYDSGMVVWLMKVEKLCTENQFSFKISSLTEDVQRLFQLAHEVPPRGFVHEEEDKSILGNVGLAMKTVWHRSNELMEILGATLIGFGRILGSKARFLRKDILRFIQTGGHEALGIVSLTAFLIGITLAIIGGTQLKKYGAQEYIANIEIVGILRELGCLITGIVMAGHTASAYAAEIGAMQVHEELDALQSLAISRTDFLVMPRVLALVITMPILVIYANVIANMGGLLFSVFILKISYLEYIDNAREAFALADFFIGIVKAFIFGYLIAIAGCLRGLQCGRSVSEVGDSATSAVGLAMILIIIANVVIDLMLYALRI